jgi:hypothetical protein
VNQGKLAGLPVAEYLRPEQEVVPFRARPELADLVDWCADGRPVSARLVTGDGGAGKTRLALRLSDEVAAAGWQPLWVRRDHENAAAAAVRDMGQPCVLVVDYAETRSGLIGLLDELTASWDGPDARVLLLARSDGEWWQALRARADYRTASLLDATPPVKLGSVPAAGGARELFEEALTAFARRLDAERPAALLALNDPAPLVLVVHAAALLAVVDHAAGVRGRQAVTASQVLDGLLGHEGRYWAKSAAARRPSLGLDISVLRLAVAVACLIGADSQTSTAGMLARVPDLEDSAERRGQVARWLHDLYPTPSADDAPGGEWLGPLRPDRLAEQLVTSELADRPELVPTIFFGLAEDRAERALSVVT